MVYAARRRTWARGCGAGHRAQGPLRPNWQGVPKIFNYKVHADAKSCLNTPPTFGVYVLLETFRWMERQGGLAAIEKRNADKAKLIYDAIDGSGGFYKGTVSDHAVRSHMNITFKLPSEELTEKFLKEATSKSMLALKANATVGGIRASVYNGNARGRLPGLADHMREFNEGQRLSSPSSPTHISAILAPRFWSAPRCSSGQATGSPCLAPMARASPPCSSCSRASCKWTRATRGSWGDRPWPTSGSRTNWAERALCSMPCWSHSPMCKPCTRKLQRLETRLAEASEADLKRYGDLQERYRLEGGYDLETRVSRAHAGTWAYRG